MHPLVRTRIFYSAIRFILLAGASLSVMAGTVFAEEPVKQFDIPIQSADSGIREFAREANVQVLARSEDLRGKQTNAVQGQLPVREALDKLIAGTGVRVMSNSGNAVVLGAAEAADKENPPVRGEARTQPTPALEQIVVTARKQVESLQNVPVAVSVVSAEQLKYNMANDLTKLAELAPQVTMTQGGTGTGAVIAIRGIASFSSDAGIDQSVVIDMDGVPMSRGRIISAALYDIAQVQVLEGPQALYFGKNSPAGVIAIQTEDPTDTFEGYATIGYEFEARERYLEGAISGPLTDTLKARLAFRASKMRGWIKNVAGPVQDIVDPTVTNPGATWGRWAPGQEDYAGRLTLSWEPADDFDATLKISVNRQTRNSAIANTEGFCINGQTQPVLLGTIPIPNGDCRKDRVTTLGSVASKYAVNFPGGNGGIPYFQSDFGLAALTLNKRFDNVTLTSTTGYYYQSLKQMGSSDWSSFATIWFAAKEHYRMVSQEVRAHTTFDGPINVMGGVYFEHHSRPFLNATDLFHSFNPIAGIYSTAVMASKAYGDYISPFGQVTWNITPTVELSGGARYSHDKKEISIRTLAANPAYRPVLLPPGQILSGSYSDSHVSPEATLSWHPKPEHTLYVAYKTGYKGGGVSNPFLPEAAATSAGLVFKPEKSKGVEVGYKAKVLDDRMQFDLTAYRYSYTNLQVISFTPPASYTLQNAAASRVEGIQGSIEWLATDDLTLRGNFGWNNAKFTDFPGSPCYGGQTAAKGCVAAKQDLSGKQLLFAPKLTLSVGGDYHLAAESGWATTLSAGVRYSSSYNGASNYAPGGYQKAYWLLNAAVRTGPEDGKYELALIGRNLTNSYYFVTAIGWSGSGNPNQFVGFFNRPREVVLQATARF